MYNTSLWVKFMTNYTRRDFTRLAAASTATGGGLLTLGSPVAGQSSDGWTVAETPTEKTLYSAAETLAGPFAVGAGGDVLARRQSGWQKVVEYGPQARSRRLTGADVTDDGRAIWFVGGSGVIGEYRVDTQTLTNYSAPKGKTSTWEDCAVVGRAGENERFYFVNGSGELLIGIRQDSGAVKYEEVIKPGGGSTIPGIDFRSRMSGHVCSTSQLVSKTTDGGKNWKRIGIDFSGASFFDVASVGAKDVNVAGGGGIVYRYDGFRWTPHVIDDGRQAIRAIDRDGSGGLAAGDGGKVYERQSAGQWKRFQTSAKAQLQGVARGKTHDVAVGASGTIVERPVDRTDSDSGTNTTTSTISTMSTTDDSAMLSDRPLSVENRVEGEWVTASEGETDD
jgi:hypothetical protein